MLNLRVIIVQQQTQCVKLYSNGSLEGFFFFFFFPLHFGREVTIDISTLCQCQRIKFVKG